MKLSFPGGMKVVADYESFTIATDQSPDQGGEGSAPEPFALFLASLATCAGVYVLSFLQARELSAEGLGLNLHTVSGPEGKGLAEVQMDLILPKDFPEKYEKAVLRVAGMCAVKKAIMNPPEITMKAVRV